MTLQWTKYPSFTEAEMRCRCCGECGMTHQFMLDLQALRDAYRRPMPVTSGYRCPAYNAKVSTTGTTGPHTTGKAVDIAVSRADALDLFFLAKLHGFTGFGINQKGNARFIHLDTLTDDNGDPRFWSY
jgi:uncharacterized protein YcbK (DUF882 family)